MEQKAGKTITTVQAEKLKISIPGRHMDPSITKKENVPGVLEEIGLDTFLTVDEAIDLIVEACQPPLQCLNKPHSKPNTVKILSTMKLTKSSMVLGS